MHIGELAQEWKKTAAILLSLFGGQQPPRSSHASLQTKKWPLHGRKEEISSFLLWHNLEKGGCPESLHVQEEKHTDEKAISGMSCAGEVEGPQYAAAQL